MKTIYALSHGINSTNDGWVDDFTAFLQAKDPTCAVVPTQYWATITPWFTNWVQDPMTSRAHVKAILSVYQAGDRIFLIGHSNGGVILLNDLNTLASANIVVAGLILIDAAIESDVRKSGIWDWIARDELGFAFSWSSHDDEVLGDNPKPDDPWWDKLWDGLWGKLRWPWGNLGNEGWTDAGTVFQSTRIWTEYHIGGHSECFATAQIQATFNRLWLACNPPY